MHFSLSGLGSIPVSLKMDLDQRDAGDAPRLIPIQASPPAVSFRRFRLLLQLHFSGERVGLLTGNGLQEELDLFRFEAGFGVVDLDLFAFEFFERGAAVFSLCRRSFCEGLPRSNDEHASTLR